MGRLDDIKRLTAAATEKLTDPDLRSTVAKAAGDAIVGASEVIDGAESVVKRSGLTKRSGEVSPFKVAKALLHPTQSARTVLDATAEEIKDRRNPRTYD